MSGADRGADRAVDRGADRMTHGIRGLCLIAALTAGPALAQSGFGGSFDNGTSQTAPQDQGAQHRPQGGFGGSFDNDAVAQPVAPVRETPPPIDDSNFDTNFTPQPPQPEVSVDQQILAFETRDFGIAPINQLKPRPLHGPTPTSIPGAGIVSTKKLAEVISAGHPFVLIDVHGGNYSLRGAFIATRLAEPGSFRDRTQQQATKWLDQISDQAKQTPMVIYCADPQCWKSYNATLRAVAAGYTNVYWYRGGIQAWRMAGLKIVPSGL